MLDKNKMHIFGLQIESIMNVIILSFAFIQKDLHQ